MVCAWKELLSVLPLWMRPAVDKQAQTAQEVRLRLGRQPEVVRAAGSVLLPGTISTEDLRFTVNAASHYSPWTAATMVHGYLTAPGGHRIGLCGEVVNQEGHMTAIRAPTSLCIRVARDFPGIGEQAAALPGNLLFIGPPGSGKTTLLRDVIRQRSQKGPGAVAVVDERGELFPMGDGAYFFPPGERTDVLTGCSKAEGIDCALRTMGPASLAVDEITAERDCQALLQAGWCGVRLLAAAHAADVRDLNLRPIYRTLLELGLFDTVVVIHWDKTWEVERLGCK